MKKTLFILPLLLSLSLSGCVSGVSTRNSEDDESSNLTIVTPGVSIGDSDVEALLHLKYNYTDNDARYYAFSPIYTPGWNYFINNGYECYCEIVDENGDLSDVAHVLFNWEERNPLVYVYPDNNGVAYLNFTCNRLPGFKTKVVVENSEFGIDASFVDGVSYHASIQDFTDEESTFSLSYSSSELSISFTHTEGWSVEESSLCVGTMVLNDNKVWMDGDSAYLVQSGTRATIHIPLIKYSVGEYLVSDMFKISFTARNGEYYQDVSNLRFSVRLSDFGAGYQTNYGTVSENHNFDGSTSLNNKSDYDFIKGLSYEGYYEIDRRNKGNSNDDILLGSCNEPYLVSYSGVYDSTLSPYVFVDTGGNYHYKDVDGNWHSSSDEEIGYEFNYSYYLDPCSLNVNSNGFVKTVDGNVYLDINKLGIKGSARDSYRRQTIDIPLYLTFDHYVNVNNLHFAYDGYSVSFCYHIYIYILY